MKTTQMHSASGETTLSEKLRHIVQLDEQVLWVAYPDKTHRAKRAFLRSSSWMMLRIALLAVMLLIFLFTSLLYLADTILPFLYGGLFLFAALGVILLVVLRRRTQYKQLENTIYAITNRRLLVVTLDRDQWVQNSYTRADIGHIDLIERADGWGDITIGAQQRFQMNGAFVAAVTPRLMGVPKVREVAHLLARLKAEQS